MGSGEGETERERVNNFLPHASNAAAVSEAKRSAQARFMTVFGI